jgi:hypothetical protein
MSKWFLQILFSFFINKAETLNFCLGGRSTNKDRNHYNTPLGLPLKERESN